MESVELLLLGITFFTATMLIIGIIRPGFAVWWSTRNTRANVLKVWGVLAVVFALAYFLVSAGQTDERLDPNATDTFEQGNR